MANAKQCDRCGKFYVYTSDTPKFINCKAYSGFNRQIYLDDRCNDIDICSDCLDSLYKWWIKIANKESENDGSRIFP